MDLLLDEAQTFLQQAVSGAVERYAPFSTIREWISAVDLAPADRLAAAQGWTGIGLAEHLGGQGGAVLELAVVAEQLGRGAVPWDRLLGGYLATLDGTGGAPPALAPDGPEIRRLAAIAADLVVRSEEHTSELQSPA